ncbi:MAG: hypothetical protein HKL98_11685 [Burkholderiales bacterium]|nr:hypothetical protein [Burkholderiales bacterium]
MTVEEKDRKASAQEEEDRSERVALEQEVERLFRHDGGDPLMRGVKAALIDFRIGK